MPEPVPFKEANAVAKGPAGSTVLDLPLHIGLSKSNVPLAISKWQLTTKEVEEIARTGHLWIVILGDSIPPVSVITESPFTEQQESEHE